jgi:hypothetical protein
MGNNMELVYILQLLEKLRKVNGMKEKECSGLADKKFGFI